MKDAAVAEVVHTVLAHALNVEGLVIVRSVAEREKAKEISNQSGI